STGAGSAGTAVITAAGGVCWTAVIGTAGGRVSWTVAAAGAGVSWTAVIATAGAGISWKSAVATGRGVSWTATSAAGAGFSATTVVAVGAGISPISVVTLVAGAVPSTTVISATGASVSWTAVVAGVVPSAPSVALVEAAGIGVSSITAVGITAGTAWAALVGEAVVCLSQLSSAAANIPMVATDVRIDIRSMRSPPRDERSLSFLRESSFSEGGRNGDRSEYLSPAPVNWFKCRACRAWISRGTCGWMRSQSIRSVNSG